ncbi:UNVERIFIED_CONTAM: hypothetical protein K2H54_044232 [Gekko kuhli]
MTAGYADPGGGQTPKQTGLREVSLLYGKAHLEPSSLVEGSSGMNIYFSMSVQNHNAALSQKQTQGKMLVYWQRTRKPPRTIHGNHTFKLLQPRAEEVKKVPAEIGQDNSSLFLTTRNLLFSCGCTLRQ